MRAIIVDDEAPNREVLRNLLAMHCPQVELIGEAEHVKSAYELISQTGPDLVFLDILMPEADGFELLRKYEEPPFDVIFVTSYSEYAIDAVRFSAIDYLLKPVEVKLLTDAVSRAQKRKDSGKRNHPLIVNLLNNAGKIQLDQKIALHTNDNVVFVPVKDITSLVGDRNYTHIHTQSGQKFISSKTMREYENFLEPTEIFVRISKSNMINVGHVKEYSKGDPCIVTMTNGQFFEIARRKKQEVLEILKSR